MRLRPASEASVSSFVGAIIPQTCRRAYSTQTLREGRKGRRRQRGRLMGATSLLSRRPPEPTPRPCAGDLARRTGTRLNRCRPGEPTGAARPGMAPRKTQPELRRQLAAPRQIALPVRHDAVQMRMLLQSLAPGVQHGEHPDAGPPGAWGRPRSPGTSWWRCRRAGRERAGRAWLKPRSIVSNPYGTRLEPWRAWAKSRGTVSNPYGTRLEPRRA